MSKAGVLHGSLATGSAMWPLCYKGGRTDAQAISAVQTRVLDSIETGVVDWRRATRGASVVSPRVVDNALVHTVLCAAKWVDGGCRAITADAKYFAAMAQTIVAGAAVTIPWPAFRMEIPRGLIRDQDGREYTAAMFAQYHGLPARSLARGEYIADVASYYEIIADDGCTLHSFWPDVTLPELLMGRDPERELPLFGTCESDVEEAESDARLRELVKRAAVGLLYTMQHTPHWRRDNWCRIAGRASRGRSGPPNHRTIVVGRPLSIDVRAAVTADARSGSRSAPSVQTLVRGHIKRQVCGTGRAERKVVWIEPYWRGPEDAPILVRPYRVAAEVE